MGFVEFIAFVCKKNKRRPYLVALRREDIIAIFDYSEEKTLLVVRERKKDGELLVKGCFREVMEKIDPLFKPEMTADGMRIIKRYWEDPLYQKRLRHPETPRQDAQER